jgi:hypothetical protein
MSLPKQLIKSYSAIANSELVVNSKVSEETIKFFLDELNKAIPSKTNVLAFTIYKFNRNKYMANKVRFMNDIIGFAYYEHMILWCDYKDILKYFNLENKIFLGWDRHNNCYKAYESKNNGTSQPTTMWVPPTSAAQVNDGTDLPTPLSAVAYSAPTTTPVSEPEVETKPKTSGDISIEDLMSSLCEEQDRLDNYMQQRRSAFMATQ